MDSTVLPDQPAVSSRQSLTKGEQMSSEQRESSMDYEALMRIGDGLHRAMIDDAVARGDFRKRNRCETAREVLRRLEALSLSDDEKRFVGDYVMSQCGYGGGI